MPKGPEVRQDLPIYHPNNRSTLIAGQLRIVPEYLDYNAAAAIDARGFMRDGWEIIHDLGHCRYGNTPVQPCTRGWSGLHFTTSAASTSRCA
jgi:hypothetical protein